MTIKALSCLIKKKHAHRLQRHLPKEMFYDKLFTAELCPRLSSPGKNSSQLMPEYSLGAQISMKRVGSSTCLNKDETRPLWLISRTK